MISATLRHWKRAICTIARIEHAPFFQKVLKRNPELLLYFRQYYQDEARQLWEGNSQQNKNVL